MKGLVNSRGELLTVADILGAHSPQEKWGVTAPVDYGVTGERAVRAMVANAVGHDPRTGIYTLDNVMVRSAQEIVHVAPVPDTGDRQIVRFVVVSGEPTRDNKILEVPGVNWRAWDANPVTMWCHDYEAPPIGRGVWRAVYQRGNVYEVWKDIEFMPHELSPFGNVVGRMYADGWLRGISGGWKGTKIKPIVNRSGKIVAAHFLESDWLEDSGCPIPIDRYSLSEAVQRGIITTDQRDVFASQARWPSLSKIVAYEITPQEVLTVANRNMKPGEARAAITRAIPTATKRTLVEQVKLHPDRVALLKPDAARGEGADESNAGDAPGATPAGEGAAAATATGAAAAETIVKCDRCQSAFVQGEEHACPDPAAAAAPAGAAAPGNESAPGGVVDPAGTRAALRPSVGMVLPDGLRGELAKGLDVGYARLKAAFTSLLEPMQELYWVCDSAYYAKRAAGLDHTPFLAPLIESMGFERGTSTPHVVTEQGVTFDAGAFKDHRTCRAWLADNGFDDNTQIFSTRSEDGKLLFGSMQRHPDLFDIETVTELDMGGGVTVTRGALRPEAAARFVAEKRAVEADEPYSVEMRGDRYLTLLEAALEAMGDAVASMRDAFDAAAAAQPTAEEQSTIATAAVEALEGMDLNDLADAVRSGRILSNANRKTVLAAYEALGKLAAIEEKAAGKAAAAKKKGAAAAPADGGDGETGARSEGHDDATQAEFGDLRARLGATAETIDAEARAVVEGEARGMRERMSGALTKATGEAPPKKSPAAPVFATRAQEPATPPGPVVGRAVTAPAKREPAFARRSATGGLPHVRVPGGPGSGTLGAQYLDTMRSALARAGVPGLDNGAGSQ